MSQDTEKILAKVRALLAKAADRAVGPEEADIFRAKADELMAKHAIAMWQIHSAEENERDIVSRNYDFFWYVGGGEDTVEHRSTLWSIMLSVARHCRVKVINYKPDWIGGTIPIVGVKSDLDWFDLLFTNIMADFVAGLEPRPNPTLSFAENIANMKDAGMKWRRIVDLMWDANMVSHEKYPERPTQQQIHKMNLSGVYSRFCDETGRHRLRVSPTVYRRSYSMGYDNQLHKRLMEMHRRTSAGADSGSGMEMVLADIYTRVSLKAEEMFPPPRATGRRSRGKSVGHLKYSERAMNDGAARADSVNISASNHHLKGRKELNS